MTILFIIQETSPYEWWNKADRVAALESSYVYVSGISLTLLRHCIDYIFVYILDY